jgi:hypothetical protein
MTCAAQSGPTAPRVVELYTSEGCSSCPPADAWLSTLKADAGVIALGFHVTYWDRLGWPDRFANPAYTQRQHEIAARGGASYVYTPQVVVDGRDWRGWPRLPAAQAPKPNATQAPQIQLRREGDFVHAQVSATARPARLAGYWAVVEDRHVTRVRAGENSGETLRHDHVVRAYQPLPAWDAGKGLQARYEVTRGAAEHPRRVVLVLTEADGAQRPLQALALGC